MFFSSRTDIVSSILIFCLQFSRFIAKRQNILYIRPVLDVTVFRINIRFTYRQIMLRFNSSFVVRLQRG